MRKDTDIIKFLNGRRVVPYSHIMSLREKRDPHNIISQKGGQENALASDADIVIAGGNRGGGKSWMLLLSMFYDIHDPNQCTLIVRKERDDLSNLVSKSEKLFGDFGTYNRSQDLMYWKLKAGGTISFSYHAGSLKAFQDRLQGREYNRIGIDEITQIDFPKFKYLQTNNRNAHGLHNQIIGTCNPDPDSWVAKFIDWWIGEDGLPIKERDCVKRYCFMNGEDVSEIIWGDTPESVYEQAKSIIDTVISDNEDWHDYILSVAFVRAELDDNVAMMESNPKYKARLAGQSEEQRQRDLAGNWRFKSAGDDLIKWAHMDAFYKNAFQYGDNVKRVSCDVAFDGGDNLVMWLWVGNHIQDLRVCHQDSAKTVEIVKSKLTDWGVREENFTYDLNGVGQTFKGFFPRAHPFNNMESVDIKVKHEYVNLKSQAAFLFAMDLIEGRISINPSLLDRKPGNSKQTLREILNIERKAIRRDDTKEDKGWAIITKKIMKQIVGHSPDYIEGLIYKKIFDIKKPYRKPRGLGWL